MNLKRNTTLHRYAFFLFTLYGWTLIAWDYFHGGVPTHYLLHDKDMPGISNWWGLILVPLISFISLVRIGRRQSRNTEESNKRVAIRFSLAIAFSITLSILFFQSSEVGDYLMLAVFLLSFWFPLYKIEFYLGFFIGSIYTFGAFIPGLAGLILVGIYFLFHTIRKGIGNFIRTSE